MISHTMLAAGGASSAVPVWATLIATVVPLGGAVLAYRQATKATKATAAVDTKKVDAEAYKIAKSFYEDMLTERKNESVVQQAQITGLNGQIQELQRSLNAMQVQMNARSAEEAQLRDQAGRLGLELLGERRRARLLTQRVTQLEAHLHSLGELIPVPALGDDDDLSNR